MSLVPDVLIVCFTHLWLFSSGHLVFSTLTFFAFFFLRTLKKKKICPGPVTGQVVIFYSIGFFLNVQSNIHLEEFFLTLNSSQKTLSLIVIILKMTMNIRCLTNVCWLKQPDFTPAIVTQKRGDVSEREKITLHSVALSALPRPELSPWALAGVQDSDGTDRFPLSCSCLSRGFGDTKFLCTGFSS